MMLNSLCVLSGMGIIFWMLWQTYRFCTYLRDKDGE